MRLPTTQTLTACRWHRTPAWGGYSWDPARYPDHVSALAFLHNNGLATGTNFHDADGVTRDANPERFAAFAAAVGAEPTADAVAFAIGNRTYADMLQRVVLDPLIGEGLDMAWASTAIKVARPLARTPARRLPPPTYVTPRSREQPRTD